MTPDPIIRYVLPAWFVIAMGTMALSVLILFLGTVLVELVHDVRRLYKSKGE